MLAFYYLDSQFATLGRWLAFVCSYLFLPFLFFLFFRFTGYEPPLASITTESSYHFVFLLNSLDDITSSFFYIIFYFVLLHMISFTFLFILTSLRFGDRSIGALEQHNRECRNINLSFSFFLTNNELNSIFIYHFLRSGYL